MSELATGTWFDRVNDFVRREPLSALLLATIVVTLVYFFGFVPLFVKGAFVSGACSTMAWAWQAWNPQMNQEHSKLVPFVSLGLVIYHHKQISAAPKRGSNQGLVFVLAGIALFLLSARCLQPRFALAALPFLIYGAVLYLWGKQVARIVLFPCAFLIFMIPVAAIEQGTFRLQFIITSAVGFLSNLVGIKIDALGTTLTAADNSFNFAIAEGCSGIRSLFAMVMLTAIYVHLTQREIWKKILILMFSLAFAIVGNIGRIFTVILVAKFIDPKLASGIYHDYSGYVFFPIALLAMLLFSKLINLRWSGQSRSELSVGSSA
jgi:exosortase